MTQQAVKEVLAEIENDVERINEELHDHQKQIELLQAEVSDLRKRRENALRTRDYLAQLSGQEIKASDAESENKPTGPYADKSIPEAGELFLASVGPPARETRVVADGIVKGGLHSDAKNLYATVFGSLRRQAKKEDSRLVKVGTEWGLRDWYPNGVPSSDEEGGDND